MAAPAYTGEIAEPRIRGALGSLMQVSLVKDQGSPEQPHAGQLSQGRIRGAPGSLMQVSLVMEGSGERQAASCRSS